ncbi:hypothetical protein A9C11_20990 [Pseudomonas citronellolis]|uniref:Uncharacterized protein n=1 Tax=Pseudomonas citronellolis TaxID=53408 RepID=A0A1A9KFJ6_9PSED|nr:hypothetical protein A9C11_20990 [Pseudomonas citronellolis]
MTVGLVVHKAPEAQNRLAERFAQAFCIHPRAFHQIQIAFIRAMWNQPEQLAEYDLITLARLHQRLAHVSDSLTKFDQLGAGGIAFRIAG